MKLHGKIRIFPLFHKISTFLSTVKNGLVHAGKKSFFPFYGQALRDFENGLSTITPSLLLILLFLTFNINYQQGKMIFQAESLLWYKLVSYLRVFRERRATPNVIANGSRFTFCTMHFELKK